MLDGRHLPDILVEKRALAPPPSDAGNRFLRGWLPTGKIEKRRWYAPAPEGAALELVRLGDSERRLTISGRVLRARPGARLTVRIASAGQVELPLSLPLQIPIPVGAPIGRMVVELGFPADAEVLVDRAWLDRALPAGVVDLAPTSIRQQPASAVDFVRPVAAMTHLSGIFEPPTEPGPGQRFRLLVEREGEPPRVAFDWQPGWRSRLAGDRGLAVELGREPGRVRIRLLAEGSGSAATWRDLRLSRPRQPPPPPSTAPPSAPRLVVVYVLDALRSDALDLSGGAAGTTPELARLAGEGVVFARHRSVAPNTVPSTKSLFTGQPFLLEGGLPLAAEGPPTLAELFAAAGYRTAAFSGNPYVSRAFGTARGFGFLAGDVLYDEFSDRPGGYNDSAERVQRSAVAWLEHLAPEDRAFLYLHTLNPHNPYDPPREIADRFTAGIGSAIAASTKNLVLIRQRKLEVGAADQERIRALYAAAVAYNDARIGAFAGALRQRFPPGEVLLVVTSDHGEELFDHGGVLHGYTLHRELLEIPLVLWWPGRLEPRRVEAVTDNLDLHESLRALVGAGPSPAAEGRPLWSLALGREERQDPERVTFAAASSLRGGIFSARSARYKLVLAPRVGRFWGMGEGRGRSHDAEYLFDLEADPGEHRNVAGRPALEAAWLRSRLHAWIERGKRLEPGGEEAEIDEETRGQLRALGYLD